MRIEAEKLVAAYEKDLEDRMQKEIMERMDGGQLMKGPSEESAQSPFDYDKQPSEPRIKFNDNLRSSLDYFANNDMR